MSKKPDGIETYKSRTGWRWRIWSKGKVIANGGQGYSRRIDMLNAIETVLHLMPASMVDGVVMKDFESPRIKLDFGTSNVKVRVTRRKYK